MRRLFATLTIGMTLIACGGSRSSSQTIAPNEATVVPLPNQATREADAQYCATRIILDKTVTATPPPKGWTGSIELCLQGGSRIILQQDLARESPTP